jgi:TM2 domain-containing membrane protein YozV
MKKSFVVVAAGGLILTVAILTFTSCVTRPYTIDDPHYITTNGASWLSSLVPGLTQFINGEYLEGSIYLLGTASTGIISGLAYNGIILDPVISSTPSDNDPTKMNEARLSLLFIRFLLAVCCASRIKSQKSDRKALFYPANCQSRPDNRDFCVTDGAKIHKCNRLLGKLRSGSNCRQKLRINFVSSAKLRAYSS